MRVIRASHPETQTPSNKDELEARYRSVLANRRVLILVDNARDEEQVIPLIPPPGCALLVTSRRLLDIDGLESVLLGVLNPDKAESLLLDIYPRIGIHASELAQLCGYLPLALRISASLLLGDKMRPVAIFLEQLREERLAHLIRLRLMPDESEASVEASLKISFDALEPDLQQLMLMLSIFPDSFNITAVDIVVGWSSINKHLLRLYHRSLLEWRDDTSRYALHDLVREFCIQRLLNPESIRLRYVRHYAVAISVVAKMYRSGEKAESMKLYDEEQVHIKTGWEWAAAHAGNVDVDTILLSYASNLIDLNWFDYEQARDSIPYFEVALATARRNAHTGMENKIVAELGYLYGLLGDEDKMNEYGRLLLNDADPRLVRAWELAELSINSMSKGKTKKALAHLKESINIFQSTGDVLAVSIVLTMIGRGYTSTGQVRQALPLYQRALEGARELGHQEQECAVLFNLGEAYAIMGEAQKADDYFEEALSIAYNTEDWHMVAEISWSWGELCAQSGDIADAVELIQLAVDYKRAVKDPDIAKNEQELARLTALMQGNLPDDETAQ